MDEPTTAYTQPGDRSADHKTIGTLFIAAALTFLLATAGLALVMRAQVTTPDVGLLYKDTYRQLFTLHGILGVFLFLAPAWAGLATALVPLQIGASRLAFPRLQAFSFWMLLAGGALIVSSPFAPGAEIVNGWSLSDPVRSGKGFSGEAPELLILGLIVVAMALTVAAANLIVTAVKFRAPGLTQLRSPVFTWSVLVSSAVLLLALPVLIGSLVLLFVDTHYGGHVFNGFTGRGGGNAAMWPRLFWFGAYPTLWALLLPALGVLTEIIAVFSRRRLFSHSRALGALAAIGVLAFAGWGSQLNDLGDVRFVFAVGAIAALLPVGSLMVNWLATIGNGLAEARRGRGPKPEVGAVPMLHALGTWSVLAVGLVGGAVLAARSGIGTNRTYWEVATQHTLFFGSAAFAFAGALQYWSPKLWGRHLSKGMGRLQFGLFFVGTHLAFLPMYVLGIQHMPFHLSNYPPGKYWEPANVVASVGAGILGLALVVLVANVVVSVVLGRGKKADADPWNGHTLEWTAASPPPQHNFDALPEVHSEAPALDLVSAGTGAPE
jgi:cytochrome c oxidase subunit 1